MAFFPPSRLTPLQRELCEAFFAREQRFFLTGGGALAGFYVGHRDTEDLDLFTQPGPSLDEASLTLKEAAHACGAQAARSSQAFPDFRRFAVTRGDEECIVDLVVDRAPIVELDKPRFGAVRVDSLREIAANKICTLVSRSEPKDLVDLQTIIESGIDVERALQDAAKKDASVDNLATLIWILDELRIAPEALLPGNVDPVKLDQFRRDFVKQLRALAFARARRG